MRERCACGAGAPPASFDSSPSRSSSAGGSRRAAIPAADPDAPCLCTDAVLVHGGETPPSQPDGGRRYNLSPPPTLLRWLKFNFVGGIGILVQFVTLFLLKSVLHFDYLAATAIAVEAAVVHNFVWHEQFTWADRIETTWRHFSLRLLRFNLTTGAVSILGNLALMKAMVGEGHVNYLLANAIAIALCSVANFLVSDQWVFQR